MGIAVVCDECGKSYRNLEALEDLRDNDGVCVVCNNPIEVEDWDQVLSSYEDDDFDDVPEDDDFEEEEEEEEDFDDDDEEEDFDDDDEGFERGFGDLDDSDDGDSGDDDDVELEDEED